MKLEGLENELIDKIITLSYYQSDAYNYDAVQIKNADLDGVILQIAKKLKENGVDALLDEEETKVTDELYKKIYSLLHSEDRYQALFTNEGKTLGQMEIGGKDF